MATHGTESCSPFPGMDPYLEDNVLWTDLHHNLIGQYRRQLAQQLRGRYIVRAERRSYLLSNEDPARRVVVPDVLVIREPRAIFHVAYAGSGVSTPSAVVTMPMEIEIRELSLLIRDVRSREIVAWIELLSPVNKCAGSAGRAQYAKKREEILRSSAHLVEIDLLRQGARFPYEEPLPKGDYYAHVSRASRRPRCEVWAIPIEKPLPTIPVPLREPHSDAQLDLAVALRGAYADACYDMEIDYSRPPIPPLKGTQAAWARRILDRARKGR